MPLDLALSTNTPTATLELRQAQPLGDQHRIAAFLVVRSGAFAAALPFVFTRDALVTFAESLDRITRHAKGIATLMELHCTTAQHTLCFVWPYTSTQECVQFIYGDLELTDRNFVFP